MKKHLVTMALAIALLPAAAVAQDAVTTPPDPEEQLAAIVERFEESQRLFFEAMQTVSDPKLMKRVVETRKPDIAGYSQEVLDIARAHPKSDIAFECLSWVMTNDQSVKGPSEASELLIRDFIEEDILLDIIEMVGGAPGRPIEDFLRAASEKSPHEEVRALAALGLAKSMLMSAEYSERMKNDSAANLALASAFYGDEAMAMYRELDAATHKGAAEKVLETTAAKYPEVLHADGTVKEVADRMLFSLRNLAIGKKAPEIEGTDIEGVAFKLSDYRGKVIMLDFWGDW